VSLPRSFEQSTIFKRAAQETTGPMLSFTNTFVLTPSHSSDQVLFEIPEVLAKDAHRKRRSHCKSNYGCVACKRRRVKASASCKSYTLTLTLDSAMKTHHAQTVFSDMSAVKDKDMKKHPAEPLHPATFPGFDPRLPAHCIPARQPSRAHYLPVAD
jgi:hypothetical protein